MNTLPDRNNPKEEGFLLAQVSEGSLHHGRETEGCDWIAYVIADQEAEREVRTPRPVLVMDCCRLSPDSPNSATIWGVSSNHEQEGAISVSKH